MLENWYNPYLAVPFLAWLLAQSFKVVLSASKGKLDLRYFYLSGGMPSAHTAAVCSLAVTALILNGFSSTIFGITSVFAAIVIYDSFGVRRASGDQAVAINVILKKLKIDEAGKHDSAMLREVLGHKPVEVVVGAILGAAVALLMNAGQIYF